MGAVRQPQHGGGRARSAHDASRIPQCRSDRPAAVGRARVNLVSPGLTDTEAYDALPAPTKAAQFEAAAARLPVGRTGLPEDISQTIRLVLNNPFVTGTIVDVDRGAHLG